MTRADKLLLAGLLLASLITGAALYGRLFLRPDQAQQVQAQQVQAVVSVRGKVIRTIELHPGTRSTLALEGGRGPATVEVDGTRVRMMEAHCENGICLKQSWIDQPGQSIVCVPGEIVIRMEGAAPLDAVTR